MKDGDIRPNAFIKHQLPGRVRLKIPQKRGDFQYFDYIAERFSDCLGITQLQLNPPAASLLICHETDMAFQKIAEFAEANEIFSLIDMPSDYEAITIPKLPVATITSSGLNIIDNSLLNFSQGRLDGRSLLFLALIGMAAHQMTRGNIMAPAATLLWYALQVLERENDLKLDLRNRNALDEETHEYQESEP